MIRGMYRMLEGTGRPYADRLVTATNLARHKTVVDLGGRESYSPDHVGGGGSGVRSVGLSVDTHTDMHTYASIHTYIPTYLHTRTYLHTYAHICIHVHVGIYIHTCIYRPTYIYTYTHVHTHTCTYSHAHPHTRAYVHIKHVFFLLQAGRACTPKPY